MGAYRAQVWAKTNGICWYCGVAMNPFEDFVEEHMDPKAQGGGNELENLTPACTRCNSRKHAKTVEEYREYLAGKGELKFWGELASQECDWLGDDIDEDHILRLDEYGQIVRHCLYIDTCTKSNLGVILISITQMVTNWDHNCKRHGKECITGYGTFSLERLWHLLRIPKEQLLSSVIYLNREEIITSSSIKYTDEIPFYLHSLPLYHTAAKLLTELEHLTSRDNSLAIP